MDTKDRTRTAASGGGRTRQTGRAKTAQSPKRRGQSRPGPEVVYTQPGPFNRNRFILQLATVVAVVLALVLGMSIFFKVDGENIQVSGTDKYTPALIVEASGIQDGDNLLTLSEAEISGKIMAELPYVERVRVDIKLPDTVRLEIVEADVVYSAEASDGTWWLLRSDGKITEKTNAADAGRYTKLLGMMLEAPAKGEQAVAAEPEPELDADGQPIPVTVLGSERLQTALTITQYLEDNGFIGDAASVDVTNMSQIQVWYGDRYQVDLGDTTQLSYKIRCMRSTIDQMKDYERGTLDISFTVMEDQVVYTPFS